MEALRVTKCTRYKFSGMDHKTIVTVTSLATKPVFLVTRNFIIQVTLDSLKCKSVALKNPDWITGVTLFGVD